MAARAVTPSSPHALLLLVLLLGCADGTGSIEDAMDGGVAEVVDVDVRTDPPPGGFTVFDLQPTSGPVAGGTEVSVSGQGFHPDLWVRFGETEAEALVWQDEGRITLRSPPAPGGAAGAVDLVFLQPDMAAYTLPGAFSYVDEVVTDPIDACRLVQPTTLLLTPGSKSEPVTGHVFVDHVTDRPGPGDGVVGQLGYGPLGANPQGAAWTWIDGAYVDDAGKVFPDDDQLDAWEAALTAPEPGLYAFTWRFGLAGQEVWSVCDTNGTDQSGLQLDLLGRLTVVSSLEPIIEDCWLVGPLTLSVDEGEPSTPIAGRVYGGLLTANEGEAPLLAELGYGPTGADPEGPEWTFLPATYQTDSELSRARAADDYTAALPGLARGPWTYTFRFSDDQGESWRVCDASGLEDGLQLDALGLARAGQFIEACRVELDDGLSLYAGVNGPLVSAWVYGLGMTDDEGPAGDVLGQVGMGALGSDPLVSEGWQWRAANYQSDLDGALPGDQAYDRYVVNPLADDEGTYSLAFRFSDDDGASWLPCDRTGSADGFSAADLPTVEVTPAPPAQVDDCSILSPLNLSLAIGEGSGPITGLIWSVSLTQGPGPGQGVTGQVGIQREGADWEWSPAAYEGDDDGPAGEGAYDRYAGQIVPASGGVYKLAYRFSVDQGETWTRCDRDGIANGFTDDACGLVVVQDEFPPVIEEIRLLDPLTADAVVGWHSPSWTARVVVPGYTDEEAPSPVIGVELGHGPMGSVPDGHPGWAWTPAEAIPNEDEGAARLSATLSPNEVGVHAVAARATVDGGLTWVYGDLDGSINGYSVDTTGVLVAHAPAEKPVNACVLQHPKQAVVPASQATLPCFARVTVSGVTGPAGWGAGVVGQIGHGPVGSAPDAEGWVWTPAWYHLDVGDETDEYAATLSLPAAGDYATAARFSTDGGESFVHCDTAGTPFDPAQAGALTVE